MENIWVQLKPDTHKIWKKWWINRHCNTLVPDIGEKSWNSIFRGGKEIRPNLYCALYSHLSHNTLPNGEIAFAIECIHIASLILDDTPYMDNATIRRNYPAIHVMFSVNEAIIFASEILLMVILIWKKNEPPVGLLRDQWWSILHTKLIQLCIGQICDLSGKEDIFTLAVLKTGTLFEMVSEVIAFQLGLDNDEWRIWGRKVGVIFQWADDWADRKEDADIGNRNVFNDQPHLNMIELYSKLRQSIDIGPEWNNNIFGNILNDYFKNAVPLSSDISTPDDNSGESQLIRILYSVQPYKGFLDKICTSVNTQRHLIECLYKRMTQYTITSDSLYTLYTKNITEDVVFLSAIKCMKQLYENKSGNIYDQCVSLGFITLSTCSDKNVPDVLQTDTIWTIKKDVWDKVMFDSLQYIFNWYGILFKY